MGIRQEIQRYVPPEAVYKVLSNSEKDELSQRAMNLFIEASMTYSASIVAQGAYIALKMKESDAVGPLLLSECLRNDSERIALLGKVAAKNHKRIGKGPYHLPYVKLVGVMNADFRLAFEFRNYPEDDLNYILTDLWREQQNSTFSEDFYLELARGLKQKREKQEKREKKSLLRRIF